MSQFYHSIAAKGEDVEEVLRQAELDEKAEATGTAPPRKARIDRGSVDEEGHTTFTWSESKKEHYGDDHLATLMKKAPAQKVAAEGEKSHRSNGNRPAIVTTAGDELEDGELGEDDLPVDSEEHHDPLSDTSTMAAPITAAGIPSSNDLNPTTILENVKMAYWWAGYYSGLHEGMQQAGRPSAPQA